MRNFSTRSSIRTSVLAVTSDFSDDFAEKCRSRRRIRVRLAPVPKGRCHCQPWGRDHSRQSLPNILPAQQRPRFLRTLRPDGTSPTSQRTRRDRGLDAAAGIRRPPGCGPDGTSPTGHAARASVGERPRPGRVCRSAAGGRPITLSLACGERRDPPCPLPGRDKPDRSEDPEGPRITRCGGKPPSACHGVRTGQALSLIHI